MKKYKKLISISTALVMAMANLPMTVFAQDDTTENTAKTASDSMNNETSTEKSILSASGEKLVSNSSWHLNKDGSYNGYIQTTYASDTNFINSDYLRLTFTVNGDFDDDRKVFNIQPFDVYWGGWNDNIITIADADYDTSMGVYTACIDTAAIIQSLSTGKDLYGVSISFCQENPEVTLISFDCLVDSEDSEEPTTSEQSESGNISYNSPVSLTAEKDGKYSIVLTPILVGETPENPNAGWSDWCTLVVTITDGENVSYRVLAGAQVCWAVTVDDKGTEDTSDDIKYTSADTDVWTVVNGETTITLDGINAGSTIEVKGLSWDGNADEPYIACTIKFVEVTSEEPDEPTEDPEEPTGILGTDTDDMNSLNLKDKFDKDGKVIFSSILKGSEVVFTDVYGFAVTVTVGDYTKVDIEKDNFIGGGMGFNSESTGWDVTEWSFQDGVKDITANANEDGTYTFTNFRDAPIFAETDTYAQIWFQNWSTSDFTYDKVELLGDGGEVIFVIENDSTADAPGEIETDEPTEDPEEPTEDPEEPTEDPEEPTEDLDEPSFEYTDIGIGQTENVTLDTERTEKYLRFVPEEDGTYKFYSSGNVNTLGYLYDSDDITTYLKYNDDGGESCNFSFLYDLEAGKTYYLKVKIWNNKGGEFDVTVENKDVDHIELYKAIEKTWIENIDGYPGDYSYSNKVWYFHYWVESSDIEDAQIKIVYKDGTTQIANVGDWIDGYGIYYHDNQSENQWTVGDNNEIIITYRGFEVTMNVSVVENPVDYIEINKSIETTWMENYDGYYRTDSYGNEYFFYHVYTYDYENARVKIYYKDGTTKIANVDSYVDGYHISCDDNQYENHWTVGDDNEIVISYMGKEVIMYVSVIENPVDHLEVVKPTEYKWIENHNGSYWHDRDGNEYFMYETNDYDYYEGFHYYYEDAQIKIYYKDGTTKIANVTDTVDEYYIGGDSNQQKNHWVVGDDNEIIIDYLGHEVSMYVSVIENPIDHLEVVKPTECKFIKDYDEGFKHKDSDGNEYFYYYVLSSDINDAQIKIYYKDGTTRIANIGDEVDGEYIYYDCDQFENPWTLGDDNEIIISYINNEVSMYVSVIENPVDHLEVIKPTEYKFIENCNGSYETDSNGKEFFYYFPAYWRIDDAQIKIYYKDGTTRIVNIGDKVDGHYFYKSSNQDTNHWVVGDQNEITIEYLGFEVTMYVTVVEQYEGVGDISPDGIVDVKDKTSLSQYIAGWLESEEIAELDISAMDLNGDGVVDVKDKTVLARHIAEWEGYEELPYLGE